LVLNDIKCIRTTLERLEGGRDILGSPDFKFSDFTLLTRPSAARCRELAKRTVRMSMKKPPAVARRRNEMILVALAGESLN
jgi:hypothetical protein